MILLKHYLIFHYYLSVALDYYPHLVFLLLQITSIKFGLAAANILYDELKIKTKIKKKKKIMQILFLPIKKLFFLKINNFKY